MADDFEPDPFRHRRNDRGNVEIGIDELQACGARVGHRIRYIGGEPGTDNGGRVLTADELPSITSPKRLRSAVQNPPGVIIRMSQPPPRARRRRARQVRARASQSGASPRSRRRGAGRYEQQRKAHATSRSALRSARQRPARHDGRCETTQVATCRADIGGSGHVHRQAHDPELGLIAGTFRRPGRQTRRAVARPTCPRSTDSEPTAPAATHPAR